jgi:hypothetical protein
MKVLVVGSNSASAIERYYINYLRQFGADVHLYPAADIIYSYHSANLFNKVLFKTRIKTGYKQVSEGLLEKAAALKPDIIWVFKGMEIYPQALQTLRARGFKLANYNPDHPFIITSRGSGNSNVTNSVGLFHLHFCYNDNLSNEINQRFGIATVFLPFAYETSDIVYRDPETITEIPRICFQGNPDRYRASMIRWLSRNSLDVDVFGIGWEKTGIRALKGVRVYEILPRPEFWLANQQYRVQLNLFRRYNVGSHNMRTFEIPAVGGIQLTTYSDEQSSFFQKDREIFFFSNQEELVIRAKELLSKPVAEIQAIRCQARKRSLESGYTFKDRALTVYNAFKNLQ